MTATPLTQSTDWDAVVGSQTAVAPFSEWDARSSVRSKPAKYQFMPEDLDAASGRHWFVPRALSYLDHPAVLALGLAARQNLEGRFLVNFMEYTALLEHQVVNRAAEVIAHGRMPISISDQTKLEALLLYTDEAYHSYFSAVLAQQVAKHLGIVLTSRSSPRILNLQALVERVQPSDRPLAQFLVGFVVETVITKEFLRFSEGVLVEPVYRVLRDHLEDEWVHGRYFSALFSQVWPRLDERGRGLFGELLPDIVSECFTIDHVWLRNALCETGLREDDIAEIVSERSSETATRLRASRGATATIHALRRAGFFEVPTNADRFRADGLIE